MFVQSYEGFEKKEIFQKFDILFDLLRRRLQVSILIFLPIIFQPSTVNVRTEFWKFWKKKEIFQKFDFLFDLTRRRLQFSILISLPKSFLPSTGNVRSKFWRIWKEREVSKVLIFNWSNDKKTANLNFDFPAETFFAKHGKCSFKNLQNLKKNQIFQILFFHSKCSFGHVECSFNEPVKIFPPIFEKSFSSV